MTDRWLTELAGGDAVLPSLRRRALARRPAPAPPTSPKLDPPTAA